MNMKTVDQTVIGLALVSQRARKDILAARITPQHFGDSRASETWRIIQHLDANSEYVDAQTVLGSLEVADKMVRKQITGAWLADCFVNAPSAYAATTYADQLKDEHDKRVTRQALERANQLLDGGETAQTVRLETLASLQTVAQENVTLTDTKTAVADVFEMLDTVTPYTPTPWRGLNTAMRGWRPGGLYIVGARPGVGKTMMVTQAAPLLAQKGPVLLESLEMDRVEVMSRMLSTATGVPQGKMKGRREDGSTALSPEDRAQLEQAAKHLESLPLMFGEHTQTPFDIREHARDLRAKTDQPLAGIFVDYLQLVTVGGRVENRTQEVSQITRQLKLLAMEFKCPVIVASQLNRNAANAGRPPNLAELRESGSIEQDADVVILLHEDPDETPEPLNPHVPGADPTITKSRLDAHVAKNRQGPANIVAPLTKIGALMDIRDDQGRPRIGDN